MRKWISLGCSALLVVAAIGCGGSGGGLATESGEMTIEEYEKQAAQAEADMNAMPEEATDAPVAGQ